MKVLEKSGILIDMLPRSALPSIEEKFSSHREREEHCAADEAIEAEKSARFGVSRKRKQELTFADLLLGMEFDNNRDPDDEELTVSKASVGKVSRLGGSNEDGARQDWTLLELSASIVSKLESLEELTVSVQRPNGDDHKVFLCSRTLSRLRATARSEGGDAETVLSWLDDNVIDGFTALINSRSEKNCKLQGAMHIPSKKRELFGRPRVRTFVLSAQFFSIWSRKSNGGYENVRRWRRKIPNYNSVGIFMFPAFVNGNHWVLAVVDVDGQQFIYYDPQGRHDQGNVMRCAKEWMEGEAMNSVRGDAFAGICVSSWPVVQNPWPIPLQKDSNSCGIFVLYVAENIERGIVPRFDQTNIPLLRMRTILILSQGQLRYDSDPGP